MFCFAGRIPSDRSPLSQHKMPRLRGDALASAVRATCSAQTPARAGSVFVAPMLGFQLFGGRELRAAYSLLPGKVLWAGLCQQHGLGTGNGNVAAVSLTFVWLDQRSSHGPALVAAVSCRRGTCQCPAACWQGLSRGLGDRGPPFGRNLKHGTSLD